jgi:hypothetical protein
VALSLTNFDDSAIDSLDEKQAKKLQRKLDKECKRLSITASTEEVKADIEKSATKFGMTSEKYESLITEHREWTVKQFKDQVRTRLLMTKLVGYRLQKPVDDVTPDEVNSASNEIVTTLLGGQTISTRVVESASTTESGEPQPGKFTTFGGDFAGGVVDGYSVYLPSSYGQSDKSYPVIMFLSGGCAVGGEVEDMYNCSGLLNLIHEPLRSHGTG